jgi:site-specific recombinase XerD
VPLSSPAQAVLREFDNLDAWGSFTWAPMARMWKKAAVSAGLPDTVVPYDLLYSFGTGVYRSTGDIRVTQELMGHALATTR